MSSRFVGVAFALSLALVGCGGGQAQPKDPELPADPPLGSEEGIASGAANTDYQRALAYIEKEHYAEAKTYLEKALKASPNNAEAHAQMGIILENEKDLAGAEKSYLKALELDPGLGAAAQNLSAIYLSSKPPRLDDAIKCLQAALEKTPGHVGVLQNLGYALGAKGDVEGASKAYETALAKGDSAELRWAYGSMLFDANQAEKAVPHLKKVVDASKEKKDANMLGMLGSMLGKGKAYGECVAALNDAIKLKGDEPEWIVRRGTCKHQLNDETGALEDYQASVKVKPDYAPGWYYMGVSQLKLQRTQSAEFSMQKAVEFGKGTPIAKMAKDKLKEIQSVNKK